MKFATRLTLATLLVAAASAFVVPPAHADGHHTEQLNALAQAPAPRKAATH